MEELSIYNLTITDDHRLKVNNEEVSGDGSILPGDSESLLAWALVQVGYIQQDSDSNMALQIEDQRPGGYGNQRVTIPPGKQVLIEALRKRTGKDLSHITEQARQQFEAPTEAASGDASNPMDTRWSDATRDHAEAADTPSEGEYESDSAEEEWADESPEHGTDSTLDTDPVLPAPPSLDETPHASPSFADPEYSEPEHPVEHPVEPPQAHQDDQQFHEEPPTEPIPAVADDQEAREWAQARATPTPETSGEQAFPFPSEPEEPASLATMATDEATPAAEPEVTEHESITSEQITYKRDRPELGEGEAQKAKGKKKQTPKSKPMIAALVVVSLLAVFLLVQLVRSQGENSYVATCIDERTMVRQSSDAGCKNDEAVYYRWWYTPSGSEVPAVNQTVSQQEGTRNRPEDATIREGYDPQGGLYGDDG